MIKIKKEKVCCIYSIINIINNKVYIGSTKDFSKRRRDHLRELKNNKHHSNHLQNSYNKYGKESFKFNIVECCDESNLLEKETKWICVKNL